MRHIRRLAEAASERYTRLVLDHPILVIVFLLIGLGLLGYKALDFKIDASTETLLLENDKDLRYTRQVADRYGVNDFLVID